jgi:DNA invertase Pin-like site-specific DNA recombinase
VRCGYEVLARFEEPGESAKTANRTELQKLLDYCRKNKGRVQFVIVFSLSRFAREKFDHFALRAHLKSLGISLRSATEPIDDTATGKLMEGVLAAFAQFDNDVRSDRSRMGMQAALALGRWIFDPPLGYLSGGHRSRPSLVHDPERGPLVRRAFEEVATGKYTKQHVLPLVTRLGLRTPIIATRQRNRPDFPVRNFVRGATCNKPLTASWSRGNGGQYAYDHCPRQCRAVTVAKPKLEGLFADELTLLQPTPGYMRLVKEHILNVWAQWKAEAQREASCAESRANTIRQKLDRLEHAYIFEQAIDAATYERHRDKFPRNSRSRANTWIQASLEQKQRLQSLFFPEGLTFNGTAFSRTNVTGCAFSYWERSEAGKYEMVAVEGIEPTRSVKSGGF